MSEFNYASTSHMSKFTDHSDSTEINSVSTADNADVSPHNVFNYKNSD